jgi:hypothetical protein
VGEHENEHRFRTTDALHAAAAYRHADPLARRHPVDFPGASGGLGMETLRRLKEKIGMHSFFLQPSKPTKRAGRYIRSQDAPLGFPATGCPKRLPPCFTIDFLSFRQMLPAKLVTDFSFMFAASALLFKHPRTSFDGF